jgi:NitT/TauT family transport system ATP-binding protein
MDEPFGALDAMTRDILHDELERIWREQQLTVLFVTHNVREAALLADRVILMTRAPGRLLEEQRIGAPRPRDLDDVLVQRVVSDIHGSLMKEVDEDVSSEMDR